MMRSFQYMATRARIAAKTEVSSFQHPADRFVAMHLCPCGYCSINQKPCTCEPGEGIAILSAVNYEVRGV